MTKDQPNKKHLDIIVIGRVQNVGFRFYTNKEASGLDVTGYVRNNPDGTVFSEVEGEAGEVDAFVDWVRQGPSWARVDEIKISEAPVTGFRKFEIR